MPNVLLIGGRGNIGSGLRTYMPRLDSDYRITSVDLPGSEDRARDPDAQRDFVDLDIREQPDGLAALMADRDLVVYLARTGGLQEMNALTDQVFDAVLSQTSVPMMVASSSVHACDGAYSVHEGVWSVWAERRFAELDPPPERVSSSIDSTFWKNSQMAPPVRLMALERRTRTSPRRVSSSSCWVQTHRRWLVPGSVLSCAGLRSAARADGSGRVHVSPSS